MRKAGRDEAADVTDAADRKLFAGFLTRYLVEFETRKIAPHAMRLLQVPEFRT
jgi:hypothetical protein